MKLSPTVRTYLLGAACGACALYLVNSSRAPSADPQPILLERVQALGDLHTARYNFTRTFEHETHLEPAAWLSVIPLATDAVHSATSNSALVSVRGSVEAGVDMRRAEIRRKGNGWLVVLPEPTVYEASANGRVYQQKRAIFWSDPNIGLKAEHLAGDQFSAAAREAGIVKLAKNEAIQRVRGLISGVTSQPVDIQFD